MYSFSAENGSRGYHVYRNTSWNQLYVNQAVIVHKEKNIVSPQIDPYFCAITITRVDKIGQVTVGHIPREISRLSTISCMSKVQFLEQLWALNLEYLRLLKGA